MFRQRLRDSIESQDPRAFLHWDEIRHTMFVDDQQYVATELEALKNGPRWESTWQRLLVEDKIGSPPQFEGYPESSGNLIHHAYHLERFVAETGQLPWKYSSVFELGGGYGSMARIFLRLGFSGNYTILDFPEFCELQRYYLTTAGFDTSKVRWITSPTEVTPAKRKSSIFLATWSLSECPLALRETVLNAVGTPASYLIGYQLNFGEVDNVGYFDSFAKARSDVSWVDSQIDHLPGNHYLFGCVPV